MLCLENPGYVFRESLASRLYSEYYGLEDYVRLYSTREYIDDRLSGMPTFPGVKLWEYWQLRARYLWRGIDFSDPPKIMPNADYVGFDFPMQFLYDDNADLFPKDTWTLWVQSEGIGNAAILKDRYCGSLRRILMRSIFDSDRPGLRYKIQELMDIWKEPKRIAYYVTDKIKVMKRKPNKKERIGTKWCGMEFSGKDLTIWRQQKQYMII